MNSASVGVYQLGQSVEVRSLQFDEVPVLDDLPGKVVHLGKLFEDFLIGTCSGFRFLQDGQTEFVEQDGTELFGRVDIEVFVSQFVNFVDQFLNARTDFLVLSAEFFSVDFDAGVFEIGQYRNQGAFDVVVAP